MKKVLSPSQTSFYLVLKLIEMKRTPGLGMRHLWEFPGPLI